VDVGAHAGKPDIPGGEEHNADIVRFVTICAAAVASVMLAACGGSGSGTFSHDDVLEILGVAPTVPEGSSWKRGEATQTSFAELRQAISADRPDLVPVVEALGRAGFERGYLQEWVLSAEANTTAETRASMFRDGAGAREAFVPFQQLTPNWIRTLSADGLGEEAVGGSSVSGAGFVWHRGNLILQASVYPGNGAAFDPVAVARALGDAMDERAKR
jgi:hypothetical protein